MPLSESIVAVVLTPEFGERLMGLARQCPVWIVRSAVNDPVIEQARQSLSDICDVTSFQGSTKHEAEKEFLEMLDTIDLHHYAWATLEIHGCSCSQEVRAALAALGAFRIEEYSDYFEAHRIVGSLEGNP